MKPSLHIVYINYMQDLYGSSIGSTIKAERLLENLEKLGHRVSTYWRYAENSVDESQVVKQSKRFKIPLLRRLLFTPKEMIKNIFEMIREYRFFKSHKPDLVIVRCDAYRYSAALLCRLMDIPLIIEADGANSYEWLTFNNKDGNIWKSWLLFIEKFNFKKAKSVFVQSNVAKEYYNSIYPDCARKLVVITNGADLRPVNEIYMKTELGIPDAAIVCGFVGSMHYWHNTGLLFDLLKHLMPKYPDLYFVMVGGGGPMAEGFKDQCSEFEWNNRVLFTGKVPYDNTHLYMNIMDIALAPYASSDMFYYSPVKVFEYMAQGLAVVTTAVGQIAELIDNKVNGLYFDPQDKNDLANQVEALIKLPELRQKLGKNARKTIEQDHTWLHKAEHLQELCLAAVN